MGKIRNNKKGRQIVETIIDDTETKKIQLDLPIKGNYDQNNMLVLPSHKRKTKIKDNKKKIVKILSQKHRKRLEKIVEKKQKKENRASLIEALCAVQATPQELEKLTSISTIQTKGLKRFFQEEANLKITKRSKKDDAIVSGDVKLNSLSGAKRRQLIRPEFQINTDDPNIVGLEKEESSDSGNDTDTDQDEVDSNAVEETGHKIDTKNQISKVQNSSPQESEEALKPILTGQKEDDIEAKNEVTVKIPAVFVDVIRDPQIQEARLKLPILAEEQQIMETIRENNIVIIAGETGSGKTTQLPQFLYETGYAIKKQIAITEPRRVAAIQMSQRVATEMNLSTREVSYLIRFEGNTTDDTKIKFMTDGVLFKEVQNDFLLTKYSVVILDEAHERSVYTDILIGLLSRIVPLRQKRGDPLKLLIMSATLRLEDFTNNKRLFKVSPPVINVETRQFPVTIHFNKRTNDNYLKEAFAKVCKIHTKLPEGGILVFVTGQQEVNSLLRKLRKAFPYRGKQEKVIKNEEEEEEEIDEKLGQLLKTKTKRAKTMHLPEINLDDYSVPGDNESELSELSGDESTDDDEITVISSGRPLWVLPLYSLLSTEKQNQVFRPVPEGARLCVIATNIAETSLTIPGVKYVVDTGKTKMRLYDKITGVSNYMVTWTSKASANQRAGRAGRQGPGHCYRLYSSAVFNDIFQDFNIPEIQQKPVDDLFLQMKIMNINKVMNFPFPTAPDLLQLKSAEHRLEVLGALKASKVTALGRVIAKFPVLPRFGKMLALSHQHDLLPYTICLVAALSVQEVLLETPIGQVSEAKIREARQKWAIIRRQWAATGNSLLLGDNMVLLRAVGAAEYANSNNQLEKFCFDNGLRHKAVIEIRKLRLQLTNEITINVPELELNVNPKLEPPTDLQAKLLRQILLSGMGDQIARKITWEEIRDTVEVKSKAKYKYAYQANNMEELVFLHSSSVLRKTLPEFVIYQEIYETNKIYMRGVSAIEPEWLPVYVPKLCRLSEPLPDPEPHYKPEMGKVYCSVSGTFGSQAWALPIVEIEYPKVVDCYKWFGRFLLEGKVMDKLGKYVSSLLSQPNIMVKSWAKLQPRTDALLKALISKEVCSRAQLEDVWKSQPNYLLDEYLKWIPESAHSEIHLLWPPLP